MEDGHMTMMASQPQITLPDGRVGAVVNVAHRDGMFFALVDAGAYRLFAGRLDSADPLGSLQIANRPYLTASGYEVHLQADAIAKLHFRPSEGLSELVYHEEQRKVGLNWCSPLDFDYLMTDDGPYLLPRYAYVPRAAVMGLLPAVYSFAGVTHDQLSYGKGGRYRFNALESVVHDMGSQMWRLLHAPRSIDRLPVTCLSLSLLQTAYAKYEAAYGFNRPRLQPPVVRRLAAVMHMSMQEVLRQVSAA
jgi:hypothetical protein